MYLPPLQGNPPLFFCRQTNIVCFIVRPGKLEKKPTAGQSKVDVGALHTSTRSLDSSRTIVHKGNGEIKVWRVEDFKLVEQPKDQFGRLYSVDSCIHTLLI